MTKLQLCSRVCDWGGGGGGVVWRTYESQKIRIWSTLVHIRVQHDYLENTLLFFQNHFSETCFLGSRIVTTDSKNKGESKDGIGRGFKGPFTPWDLAGFSVVYTNRPGGEKLNRFSI